MSKPREWYALLYTSKAMGRNVGLLYDSRKDMVADTDLYPVETTCIKVREVVKEKPKPLELWAVLDCDGEVYETCSSLDSAERCLEMAQALGNLGPYRIVHTVEPTALAWPADAPAWANWWARNEDGKEWFFEDRPSRDLTSCTWLPSLFTISGEAHCGDLAPGKPWTESLVSKP